MSLLNYTNRELVGKSRFLRSHSTKTEILLWSKLRSKQIEGFKFRRQQPIFNYIVDFYCDRLKLIIEIDGNIHSDSAGYDKSRENFFLKNGFHTLRFRNQDVELDLNTVLSKIQAFIVKIITEENKEGFSTGEK